MGSVTTKAAALRWKRDNGCLRPQSSASSSSVAPVLITMKGNVADFNAFALARVKAEIGAAVKVDKSLISVQVIAGSVVLAVTLPNQASAEILVQKVKSKKLTSLAGESIENVQIKGQASSSSSSASSSSATSSS